MLDADVPSATIRRAVEDDAEALSALADRLFVQTFVEELGIPYPLEDLQGFLAYANGPEAMARRLRDRDIGVWLAEHAGRPVAYAVAGPADLPHEDAKPWHGMLSRLYLESEWRGRGLAAPMLLEALGWLETDYSARPWLTVWIGNHRAQRFYARHGFEVVGQCDYPIGEWIDRELVMRRA